MRYALPLLLILAGCAPHMVSGNAAGGIIGVQGTLNGQKQAMRLADTECAKYGKIARSQGVNDLHGTMRYECVKP